MKKLSLKYFFRIFLKKINNVPAKFEFEIKKLQVSVKLTPIPGEIVKSYTLKNSTAKIINFKKHKMFTNSQS